MNNVINLLIILIVLLVFNVSCVSHSSQPQKDPELIKRLDRINEILDKIEKHGFSATPNAYSASDYPMLIKFIAQDTKVRFLIENSDIALPIMFERLDNKKPSYATMLEKEVDSGQLSYPTLLIYFIVFGHTKSAESIPYLAEYIVFAGEEEIKHFEQPGVFIQGSVLLCAYEDAQDITSLKLIDKKRTFLDQRKEIADRLHQWYEDYQKAQDKNKD